MTVKLFLKKICFPITVCALLQLVLLMPIVERRPLLSVQSQSLEIIPDIFNDVDPLENIGFTSACMLIMDDNHWLVEWIAYHWTALNLRNMIIAVDGRSKTSPVGILDRWKSHIDIELWNDSHIFPQGLPVHTDLQNLKLKRQQTFYAKCLKTLKQRNARWTLFTDTDEFVVLNPLVVSSNDSLYGSHALSPNRRGYVLSMAHTQSDLSGNRCLSMPRLQMTPDDSTAEEVQKDVPAFLNGSDFLSLRWRKASYFLQLRKSFVDLLAVDTSSIKKDAVNHHYIFPLCRQAKSVMVNESALHVYHYVGTQEQADFRNDARKPENMTAYVSKNPGYDRNMRYKFQHGRGRLEADEARPWLSTFLKAVGEQEALRLLKGVGHTTGWQGPETLQGRFAEIHNDSR